jgi:hypothetical protein
MGIDISGWIEVRTVPSSPDPAWDAIVDSGMLLDRSYDLFGCLFGVANYAHFRPIAPLRGIPDTAADRVMGEVQAWSSGGLWPTWITLPEIHAMDLDEPALYADSRLWHEPLTATEPVRNGTKSFGASAVMAPIGMVEEVGLGVLPVWAPDLVWEERGMRLRTGILTRREVLTPDWWRLVRIMDVLGEQFGPEHVRLVVWFDR